MRGVGNREAPLGAARRARQRHAGAGLRARRRASRRRAARRRGGAAVAARIAELRRDLSGEEFLAAAVAGYEIGPRVGLCMGPEHIGQGWHSGATLGVFSAAAGAARGLRARRRADGARARHRRHAGGGPDGGAVRRDGEAHARRPRLAERPLRRAPRRAGIHRHRGRVRERVRRLLHDLLALAGTASISGS